MDRNLPSWLSVVSLAALAASACGENSRSWNWKCVGFVTIAAGSNHTCALTSDGGAQCWGNNHDGQLGDGTTTGRTEPEGVSGLSTDVVAVAADNYHTCALTTAGCVRCLGDIGL